nr:probable LRR receptor-like serine/threonine-protein kinase At3g47570 [Ipomoea batatas]GME11579.1 probable LRR receptor-like serine/threonine-protein kinase At3g47570 [Ipomoea batatas]GME18918.1 probable LRR receptor-like serine/threonine-protein kinase At3g47570 [Ipomoea batatas]GME20546.1 probable LRR receptor-like serine/threonine-protein kinase At3g47570 [Ipomoea batatas]
MSSSLFCFYAIFAFLCKASFPLPGNVSDHRALLSLKANIIGDPLPLQSWNHSTHICNWVGISCGRKHQRVVTIDLESSNLQGSLSPAIGNLSFLRELILYNNSLAGIIPKEMGRLTRLSVLVLETNVFSGEIPKNLSHCVSLTHFYLGNNNLTGTFPFEFRSLFKLEYLSVPINHLMGEIPAYIGNFSSLKALDFSQNNFKGKIPTSFGCLQKVFGIFVHTNYLTSTIPISIFNLSSLVAFDVQENKLEGYLPSNLGSTLPNLEYFYIGDNLLRGRLPISMSNATALQSFNVRYNDFYGGVPSFSGLKRLKFLSLDDNPLGNGKSTDLDFMSSLLNSTAKLEVLYLVNCNLGGVLPRFIANLSSFRDFRISRNAISGTIPSEIGLLVNLEYLDLSENQLGGTIPSSWGSLQQLILLHLEGNNLTGKIPEFLGKLQYLKRLNLSFNHLEGEIPTEGIFKNKTEVEVVGNNLCGEYGMGSDLSTFGDMYSYGILLLEIFTNKSPTSDIFNNGLTLHNYVRMSMPEQVIEIVDPKLFNEEANATHRSLVLQNQIIECLASIFKIGIACSMELPRDRMSIGNAVKELHSIKDTLVRGTRRQ